MQPSTRKKATTEDGQFVYLNDDGTWQYANDDSLDITRPAFRKTAWGMNKQQVKCTEELQVTEESDNIIGYQTILLGLQCHLFYIFVQDKLVRSKYVVTETHSNENTYLLDFENLKEMLTKKYGKPKEDRRLWQNDLYQNDIEEWGHAIARGDLSIYAMWSLNDTDIFLGLSGDNFELKLVVEYSSRSLAHLEEAQRHKQALDNL